MLFFHFTITHIRTIAHADALAYTQMHVLGFQHCERRDRKLHARFPAARCIYSTNASCRTFMRPYRYVEREGFKTSRQREYAIHPSRYFGGFDQLH